MCVLRTWRREENGTLRAHSGVRLAHIAWSSRLREQFDVVWGMFSGYCCWIGSLNALDGS